MLQNRNSIYRKALFLAIPMMIQNGITNAVGLIDNVMVGFGFPKMGVKSYVSYIAYAISPMAIIDLLSITPVIGFLLPGNTIVGMFRMLRLLRIFQLLRVLKLFRYSKTLVTIVRVAKKVKSQLLAVLILTFMYIITSALLIFQIEPNLFNSFFDAMYWGQRFPLPRSDMVIFRH